MLDPVSVMVGFIAHKAGLVERCLPDIHIERSRIGAATLFTCERWPRDILFNRAYGVDAADTGTLAAITTNYTSRGLRPLLELVPERIDPAAQAELVRLELAHLWDVMELSGDASAIPDPRAQDIAIQRSGPSGAEAFAQLGVEAYEFSPAVRAEQLVLWSQLGRDPSSHCLIAACAGTPCAVGILTLLEGVAMLNGAATLPAFRQRGCQGALISHRIETAHQLGIRSFFVRTLAGSRSQRNLERYGLRPCQLRQVWGVPLKTP